MERVSFIYKIHPEMKGEYKKAHDNIWSELKKAIKECGINNWSIYFSDDGTMFSYFETENFGKSMSQLGSMEINTKWQNYMEKFFVKNKEDIIGPEIKMLENVFYLP
ncbi:MAG: L-rhamnose mutarotase [Actinobacteria bacterium]|nr:L-rhamnose mutarotase [Actinomycetota bacterium]